MNTLSIEAKNAQKAHSEADPKGKTLLENLFGKKTFQLNYKERFKTFIDILEYHEMTAEQFKNKYGELEKDEIGYIMFKMIVKAINGDWTPDFSNVNQSKYEIRFKWSSSVGGFSYDVCDCWLTRTAVGSRLCVESVEKAEYVGTQFINELNDFLTH
jgi:hypothetical protein